MNQKLTFAMLLMMLVGIGIPTALYAPHEEFNHVLVSDDAEGDATLFGADIPEEHFEHFGFYDAGRRSRQAAALVVNQSQDVMPVVNPILWIMFTQLPWREVQNEIRDSNKENISPNNN